MQFLKENSLMGSREAVAMVKIDLITGFLGAGKTTFLKKYAEYLIAKGQNIGILENDFGAVNVDMMLLQTTASWKWFPVAVTRTVTEDVLRQN